jgi:hypothetical protein
MASLAAYILVKTHRLKLDATARIVQKNVAAVAFVFCVCHMPAVIHYGEIALQKEGELITHFNSTVLIEIVFFFVAVNNTANIFIYVAVGKKFRTTLFDMFTVRPRLRVNR